MAFLKLNLPEKVDLAWCSEACKRRVQDEVIKKYPCKQKFARVDIIPLYADDPQRFYRVTLWVNDWSGDLPYPIKAIWKTFYVTLEGAERRVVSIEEHKKKRLEIGENGLKFMQELEINKERV